MTESNEQTQTPPSDDLVRAFLAAAAEVEPGRLSSPAQLLWRAEVLARLEADERRAWRALLPTYAAIALAALVFAGSLTVVLAGAELGTPSGIAAWLVVSPLRPLGLGAATLAAVLALVGRAARRPLA